MGIGVWQIVLILAIVLIIFGAGKLPKVMGDMGKGIKSFKAGINEKEEQDAGCFGQDHRKHDLCIGFFREQRQ